MVGFDVSLDINFTFNESFRFVELCTSKERGQFLFKSSETAVAAKGT